MTSEIKWLVQDRVLLFVYTGTVKTEDVINTTTKGTELLNKANGKVHVVNDFINMDGLSPQLQKVGEILSLTRAFLSLEHMGMMIAFGSDNQLVKFLSNLVSQVGRVDFRMFDTYDQAIQHLIHNDPDLADKLNNL